MFARRKVVSSDQMESTICQKLGGKIQQALKLLLKGGDLCRLWTKGRMRNSKKMPDCKAIRQK